MACHCHSIHRGWWGTSSRAVESLLASSGSSNSWTVMTDCFDCCTPIILQCPIFLCRIWTCGEPHFAVGFLSVYHAFSLAKHPQESLWLGSWDSPVPRTWLPLLQRSLPFYRKPDWKHCKEIAATTILSPVEGVERFLSSHSFLSVRRQAWVKSEMWRVLTTDLTCCVIWTWGKEERFCFFHL